MVVGNVVRWGSGVINPHLVSCAFYMLSFEKYSGRYNSCRKHGWVGGGGARIVLVFTGVQSAQPLFQLSAMLIMTINHIFCVYLLSTNMGISGPWHHVELSCLFVVNCISRRSFIYCKDPAFQRG